MTKAWFDKRSAQCKWHFKIRLELQPLINSFVKINYEPRQEKSGFYRFR
jgi:hypothetical protein